MIYLVSENEGMAADLPEVFIQVVSFHKSVIWIWIGDQRAEMANLSLAIKSHNVEKPKFADIHSTTGKLRRTKGEFF